MSSCKDTDDDQKKCYNQFLSRYARCYKTPYLTNGATFKRFILLTGAKYLLTLVNKVFVTDIKATINNCHEDRQTERSLRAQQESIMSSMRKNTCIA